MESPRQRCPWCPAAERVLEILLKRHGRACLADLGRDLGKGRSTVHYWIYKGKPKAEMVQAIKKWSGGEITEPMWTSS